MDAEQEAKVPSPVALEQLAPYLCVQCFELASSLKVHSISAQCKCGIRKKYNAGLDCCKGTISSRHKTKEL
jgi:hypothetical protein